MLEKLCDRHRYRKSKYIEINENFNYGNIPIQFSLNNNIMSGGKLVLKSEETYDRLSYLLSIELIRNINKILTFYDRQIIENYYTEISDFDSYQFQVILKGSDSIQKFIESNLQDDIQYKLYDTILKESLSPYFFKNKHVDDNIYLYGKEILGIRIISFQELKTLSRKIYIKNILVAIPSLSESKRTEIINKLDKICSNIEFLPNKKNLISDKINLSDINSLDINHILNRKQKIFTKKDFSQLKNKNILITGAGGSIGSELCKQLSIIDVKKIVALDHSEISIYNLKKNLLKHKKIQFVLRANRVDPFPGC